MSASFLPSLGRRSIKTSYLEESSLIVWIIWLRRGSFLEFLGLMTREGRRGLLLDWREGQNIDQPPGRRHNNVNWSNNGGKAKIVTLNGVKITIFKENQPQPDNREGDEVWLTYIMRLMRLIDLYYDGVTFHDIACHHKKPIICEALIF
jgi:hypothetical protein